MARIFRPSTFNKLKPLLQQPFAKPSFNIIQPRYIRPRYAMAFSTARSAALPFFNPKTLLDLQQSISNQTHVSTALATHLLSNNLPESNIAFSPLSLHSILSLLANGSKGQTLDQLLAFLKADTIDELNSLYSELVSLILADGGPNGGPLLSFVTGVWVEKTLSIKPSFQQVVDTVYNGACNQADFMNKASEVVNDVNLWAKNKTNGLINEVLRDNDVGNLTRLIIANAVYFKGAWSQKFEESCTKESDFHLLDGNKVQVPFMTNRKTQFVQEYDDFKVLGLPYLQGQDKRKFTMYFFLPNAKDGLQSLIEKIGSTPDFFNHHIPREKVEVGRFLIPKFKISSGFKASDIFEELGLDISDFSEMVNRERLYLCDIHHKAFVDVNEKGTEAAAVSIAVSVGSSYMTITKEKVDFVADHPFLFMIREEMTGAVFFIGHVINPSV
ncbi:hypothetical protein SSX86_015984 [Deinandra increscens subsp. villosa]|uniref:Serpin domain-containing protein n=1 Tax=Deinandra increscens subsp. villosa TaxID=3103831 RepID=A0AAP0GXZ4_9ASTR